MSRKVDAAARVISIGASSLMVFGTDILPKAAADQRPVKPLLAPLPALYPL